MLAARRSSCSGAMELEAYMSKGLTSSTSSYAISQGQGKSLSLALEFLLSKLLQIRYGMGISGGG